jgi:hypothetical protein
VSVRVTQWVGMPITYNAELLKIVRRYGLSRSAPDGQRTNHSRKTMLKVKEAGGAEIGLSLRSILPEKLEDEFS